MKHNVLQARINSKAIEITREQNYRHESQFMRPRKVTRVYTVTPARERRINRAVDLMNCDIEWGNGYSVARTKHHPYCGKNYYIMYNVGKVKYLVNFHDGQKTHPDGSRFYDVKTFRSKRKMESYIRELIADGYIERPTFI